MPSNFIFFKKPLDKFFYKFDDITRDLSHFVRAILPDCGVLKVLRSMPEGVRLQNNITQSVRSKDRVDYFALNNLFFQQILKQFLQAKGNINPGQKCIKWRDLSASGNRY